MKKASYVQLRAVLLALMLVGTEAARIDESVGMLDVDVDEISQEASVNDNAFFQLDALSPVCSSGSDGTAAVDRYRTKSDNITKLSARILEKNCARPSAWNVPSCLKMVSGVRTRIKEFQSCDTLLMDKSSSMPAELRTLLTSSAKESIPAIMPLKPKWPEHRKTKPPVTIWEH